MFSRAGRSGRHLPLRSHLLTLVLGTLLPALIVAGLLIRRVVVDNRTSIENSLIATARAQAAVVDRELTGTIRALQGLAQSDRLVTGELPPFRDQAVRLLHEQSMWSDVILSRPDGQQEMSSAAPAEEALPAVSDPDVFARVIATAQPMIGDPPYG